ncbi:DUF1800 domain-containing protein [Limnobacter humi]|uniref:DUF1800 domain-containing protein n=1 Tax=Limnobacter humi TaxID=1778671 RepID=A0ABT1WH72_9BURK|nr:DUF1800 domain-containing protein [Limnobacter humi]MCQ8896860.1 DUF1800 domain-containing protein [Limnobacter humi]
MTVELNEKPDSDSTEAPVLIPLTHQHWPLGLASAGGLLLSACGGEGTTSAAALASAGENAAPGAAPDTVPMTEAEASRFLGQAQMFAKPADISVLMKTGYGGWLNSQFSLPVQQTAWDWLIERGRADSSYMYNIDYADYFAWKELLSSEDTLRKRMALIWSEIMVVSLAGLSGEWQPFYMAGYWDLLNQHAFGNFRELLGAISRNPAMGKFLNIVGSAKADPITGRQPDENYAREVMQLFTVGLYQLNRDGTLKLDATGSPMETYSQQDVTELAKVFTGWNLDKTGNGPNNPAAMRNPLVVIDSKHSPDSIKFLGVTIPANTPAEEALKIALDTLFAHPNVAPFIAKQLIQKMVTSNPSAAYVADVAQAFENNGQGVRGDLKAVIRSILLHREARDLSMGANPSFGRLRSPVSRLIQWARTFNAKMNDPNWNFNSTIDAATRFSQSPFRAPSVFNFYRPNYVPPDQTFATRGLVGPEFQIHNEVSIAAYINYMYFVVRNYSSLKADYTELIQLALDTPQLIGRIALLLAGQDIPATIQKEMAAAVATIPAAANNSYGLKSRVEAALLLVLSCPQYMIQK